MTSSHSRRQEETATTPGKSKVITFSLPSEMAEQIRQLGNASKSDKTVYTPAAHQA